ncbi:hypothetical protein [Actinoplanes siamensis]|nr:hypothetical protein [Actinoplanes siamensis]
MESRRSAARIRGDPRALPEARTAVRPTNSANSRQHAAVSRKLGMPSHVIDDAGQTRAE